MKKLALLVLSINSFVVGAQTGIDNEFKTLQLNASPAYVVLGVDPENIQRPNSPVDFVANTQSALVNGRLQPNFAMETSPYFWKKRTSAAYDPVAFVSNKNYWQNLAKSITFSFATSPSDSFTFGSIATGTGIGLGLHLQLFQGNVSSTVRSNILAAGNQQLLSDLMDAMINKFEAGKNIDNMDDFLDELFGLTQYAGINEKDKTALRLVIEGKFGNGFVDSKNLGRLRNLGDQYSEKAKRLMHGVNTLQSPLTREGFMMELSIANASIAEQSRWDMITNARTSIWLSPSYRFNVSNDNNIDLIDLMAVGRIIFNSSRVDSSNYFDGGFRLQWIHNKVSVSGEGIIRCLTKKPENQGRNYSWRTDFSLSYKISDAVTFKATLGSNFDGTSIHYSDPKKMFAVGGFNFGFSDFMKKASDLIK